MLNSSSIYIIILIIALLIIFLVIFFIRKDKKHKPLSTLTGLSLMFVLAGIIFGDNRWIGYSLIGIGIILTIIDIINKKKK